MKKATIFLSAALVCAAVAVAGNDSFQVAKFDKDINLKSEDRVSAPVVTESYEYYEIKGDTGRELRRQMSLNGTKWNDGKTYDALTTWDVRWNYSHRRGPDGYIPDSFRTTVDIVFRYPKWIRGENAPQELTANWERYMANLIEHEIGHRDLAVKAAAEINEAVAQMKPVSSRSELDRMIREIARGKMAEMKRIQVAYDDETGHGRTQGAVFP